MRKEIRRRAEFLEDRVDFQLDGWRRWAYWACVCFLGMSFGVRYGHPQVAVVPGMRLYAPATADVARGLSQFLVTLSVALLTAVVGRNALVDDPERESDE